MHVTASVSSAPDTHSAVVGTDGHTKSITIPPKSVGAGSSVNGGDLFFLALATCYCNDLDREAATRGITLSRVDVEITGDFHGRGEPATGITHRARIDNDAPAEVLDRLLVETDTVG
jgi:organic hydroperoxide reductase OsmC/OhrA